MKKFKRYTLVEHYKKKYFIVKKVKDWSAIIGWNNMVTGKIWRDACEDYSGIPIDVNKDNTIEYMMIWFNHKNIIDEDNNLKKLIKRNLIYFV